MALLLLCFAGFLRCQEALQLRRSDIAFHASYMAVFLKKSKTDMYRTGRTVLIARTDSKLDPVSHLYRYFTTAAIPDSSTKFIFRAITKTKGNLKQYLRVQNKPIGYSTARSMIHEALQIIGEDHRRYGTHSLRSGGATAAANQGVPDRLFKAHGRWRSEDAKDRYVKDSLQKKLKVTLNLGLSCGLSFFMYLCCSVIHIHNTYC